MHLNVLLQMHNQEASGQYATPQQGSTYGSYDQYSRQAPAQQAPAPQQYEYANPQQQQSDPRLFRPPPGQQRPPAPADWAGQSQGKGLALDQSQGSEAYRQMPTGRWPPEPFDSPQQTMGNDPAEFGMGRRGHGVFGGGGGQRGQMPLAGAAAGGTGAASVMALGQNKIPQRAEVPSSQRLPWFIFHETMMPLYNLHMLPSSHHHVTGVIILACHDTAIYLF